MRLILSLLALLSGLSFAQVANAGGTAPVTQGSVLAAPCTPLDQTARKTIVRSLALAPFAEPHTFVPVRAIQRERTAPVSAPVFRCDRRRE